MPVLDGWELVRIVRERWPSLTTIVVSGSGDFGDPGRRGVELLVKPVGLTQLREALDRVAARLAAGARTAV
jgi:YesN/AraC family two-component response regulator